jgi:2-succinyl-6-hydroxy-2,4-cyclohexadiene-1-carboxylate synthase
MLHLEERGAGPRLALVHGFTQSGRAWGPAADALAGHHRLLVLDAPGHGRSAGVEADLPAGADLMAEVVGAGGPAAWLGYSMGGRYALHVALRHPGLVERLVVVSATGGIDDPAEREARRRADEALAARVEAEGVEPFVRWWLAQPMFAAIGPESAQTEARLDNTAAGLSSSLRRAGPGNQEPLWDVLGGLAMPVLVVAGGLDAKYCELAARLARCIGTNATVRIVEDAGHACHLTRPEAFVEAVEDWL